MEVRQDASRLRAVVNTAVDGVILIDAQGIILMFNPACERLFGYAAFEVTGRNVKMLMPEPYQGEHDGYLRNYRETGERKIIGIGREVLGRKRGGATFPMDLSVGEAEEDGNPIYVAIIRDLTERNAAAEAVRKGAMHLQAVIETAVDGVILTDARGRIQIFNPACERLFGYTQEEIFGRPVRLLFSALYGTETSEGGVRIRDLVGRESEILGRRKDGGTFPVEVSIGEAEQDGNAIFVGIIHDLTNRKRTQEQLVQAQKMEMVGQLSGGIAHDFNNLLTVVLGNAEALSIRLKARPDLQGLADTIITSAERGAELTRRLLAFSRRQVLQPSAIDCGVLVENMRILLRRALREDVELRIAVPETPIRALADPAQLESALLNLSINAQDAMPNGGALTLTTEEVELDPKSLGRELDVKPGSYVCIAVTDDGTGMTPETIARAFEPFYTTKEVGKGSGLGLSMVYGFARQSNGYVTIYSELGLGTSVRVYLPVAQNTDEAPRAKSTVVAPGGSETLLVVEDDPFVRNHAISSLEALGYRVLVASNGRDALAILSSGAEIDLLFTDVVMPGGLSGWQLADEARRTRPNLPVLFTSGYPLDSFSTEPQPGGQTLLLSKPYRQADLASRVREALASKA